MLWSAQAAPAAEPVLGSPDYVLGGGGFGTYAPTWISNGGVPSGTMHDIRWRDWGAPVATARAKASIYRPQGAYFPPVGAVVRAQDLGTCPGRPEQAYRTLMRRVPQWPGGPLGPWLKWSGSRTLCGYADTDPAYDHPARPPGLCGSVGDDYEPSDVYSIVAYRLSCARARDVARRVGDRGSSFRCADRGCSFAVRRLTCRLARLHAGEMTLGSLAAYPVQRLACRRGDGVMSAWLVLPYD